MSWQSDNLEKLSVLVVDDEPLLVKMVVAVLRDMGISSIYTANNGVQALEHFAGGIDVIDLVICDWLMPEMDGLQFLECLREIRPDIPFLMLTIQAEKAHIIAAKDTGVTAYMAKPVDPGRLRERVKIMATSLVKKKAQ